jgi:beta-xylosidase
VHAWAGSRAGIKSILTVHEMSPDGKELLDNGVMVFDGHRDHRTVEGSKFYKRDGYYYIFAPAGGVPTGWQLALRSKDIWGPYTEKIVLHQGETDINGPHQGAWINTASGEDWFIHFQDRDAYGRVVHLQPMQWKDGWPIMGTDQNGDGIGEPVSEFKKPDAGAAYAMQTPQSSDEFTEPTPGLQWQWQANPTAYFGSPTGRLGFYRLNAIPKPEGYVNFWQVPNLLLQKFTAEAFTATAKIEFFPNHPGEKTGLIIMGEDYSHLSLHWNGDNLNLEQTICNNARKNGDEHLVLSIPVEGSVFYLQARIEKNAHCRFYYSNDGLSFTPIGEQFTAVPGRWIGAKIGLFALSESVANDYGYTNVDWFRIDK